MVRKEPIYYHLIFGSLQCKETFGVDLLYGDYEYIINLNSSLISKLYFENYSEVKTYYCSELINKSEYEELTLLEYTFHNKKAFDLLHNLAERLLFRNEVQYLFLCIDCLWVIDKLLGFYDLVDESVYLTVNSRLKNEYDVDLRFHYALTFTRYKYLNEMIAIETRKKFKIEKLIRTAITTIAIAHSIAEAFRPNLYKIGFRILEQIDTIELQKIVNEDNLKTIINEILQSTVSINEDALNFYVTRRLSLKLDMTLGKNLPNKIKINYIQDNLDFVSALIKGKIPQSFIALQKILEILENDRIEDLGEKYKYHNFNIGSLVIYLLKIDNSYTIIRLFTVLKIIEFDQMYKVWDQSIGSNYLDLCYNYLIYKSKTEKHFKLSKNDKTWLLCLLKALRSENDLTQPVDRIVFLFNNIDFLSIDMETIIEICKHIYDTEKYKSTHDSIQLALEARQYELVKYLDANREVIDLLVSKFNIEKLNKTKRFVIMRQLEKNCERYFSQIQDSPLGYKIIVARNANDIQKHQRTCLYIDQIKYMMRELKVRNITDLFHFTPIDNLASILEKGIIPRSYHRQLKVRSICTDSERYDHRLEYTSLSIMRPNSRMLYYKRAEKIIVILRIDAQILLNVTNHPLFFQENASRLIYKEKPSKDFMNVSKFTSLFPTPESNITLSDQAEILLPDIIDKRYIKEIIFFTNSDLQFVLSHIKQESLNGINLLIKEVRNGI